MKKLFLLALLALALSPARSDAAPLVRTQEVAPDPLSVVRTIYLSSGTPVDVTAESSSGTVAGAWSFEVFNIDSSSGIACGFDPSVSIDTGSTFFGRLIKSFTGWVVQVRRDNIPLYCKCMRTDTPSGDQCRATITQLK